MKSIENQNQKIMTAREVSQYLRLPLSSVYDLAVSGRLRAAKCGKQWRFIESDVVNYLRGVRPSNEFRPPASVERRQSPRLKTNIFATLSGMHPDLEGQPKQGLIGDLSEGGLLFIKANASFEIGYPVTVVFLIPQLCETELEAEGRIVHRSSKEGIGIKFRLLSQDLKEMIRAYVG